MRRANVGAAEMGRAPNEPDNSAVSGKNQSRGKLARQGQFSQPQLVRLFEREIHALSRR